VIGGDRTGDGEVHVRQSNHAGSDTQPRRSVSGDPRRNTSDKVATGWPSPGTGRRTRRR
jgi:hypothetical protein